MGKTNRLTLYILIAMIVGVFTGWLVNQNASTTFITDFSSNIKLLSNIFIRLVQMIIAPLVFTTLVVGIAKLGDMQFQYQYFRKEANSFVSQFTDDDIGSGSGVNLKGHEIRVNFGLTRFLAWENRLYIQNGIAVNNPTINFFVPLQQGYRTQYRVHSQFVFTF